MKPQGLTNCASSNSVSLYKTEYQSGSHHPTSKEGEDEPEQVQVASSKLSKIEVLLQVLRQLTSEVANLKQTQKVTATKLMKKVMC